jgi:type I restriction enzyme R subunit
LSLILTVWRKDSFATGDVDWVTEADTCRIYVLPKLHTAGWSDDQIAEQRTFTDGRIVVVGDKCWRGRQKRADYILRYRQNFPIAVVEAKAAYKNPADGLQQAKEYAIALGLKFAYSTNGHGIVEHDFITGRDNDVLTFPSPDNLWRKLSQSEKIDADDKNRVDRLLTPCYRVSKKMPRYYQEIAINRAVQAILQGRCRVLLTMATGTGKTLVAFQIIWKLWSTRWNRKGEYRRPRVLFLADRNILVEDPMSKDFAVFGDARWEIKGRAVKSREIYFATYQAIAKDERRPGLFREYSPDFFDLIIVDECHRGSAKDESNWREILEYFKPAYQLGMTATPLRDDNRDTYRYFGNPVYIYSLKQGIEDGFLAPYRVHRIVTSVDATGWRPTRGEMDRYGREIPDKEYETRDFERVVSLKARTQAVAQHLTEFLKKTDRYAKTIVFCVDQEHAEDMRKALNNLNVDLVRKNPDYVCRIVSDEGDTGRGHLSNFMELERTTPTLVTTSRLLTTGVDVPLCKNVVLFRVINSMVDFKQTIGRGTRIRDDYGKLYFNILDYTGSATRLFADSDFDGFPTFVSEEEIDAHGKTVSRKSEERDAEEQGYSPEKEKTGMPKTWDDTEARKHAQKYYVNGGSVEIAVDYVYELDADGKQLKVVSYTEYTAEKVRSMFTSTAELRSKWSNAEERRTILKALDERGITLEHLAEATKMPDADPFDLLCHVAFNAPVRTRRERAERVRTEEKSFFEKYQSEARGILAEILDKYEEFGVNELTDPNVLKVPPLSKHGNIGEIAAFFGGVKNLLSALNIMQNLLYMF